MKHTPGPWVIDWNVSRLDVFSSDAATLIATLRRSTLSDGIGKTTIANARLIAAAPDLLEALEDCLRVVEFLASDSCPTTIQNAKAAIEKAVQP